MNKYSNAYRILSHMFGGRSRRAARPRHTLSRRARRMSSGSTRPPPRTALCVTGALRTLTSTARNVQHQIIRRFEFYTSERSLVFVF